MQKRIIIVILLILALTMAGLTGCSDNEVEDSEKQVFEVKRGDLLITVSVDGSLVMPYEVELRFGTPGMVREMMVEKGDVVKAGTILATLDSESETLDIKSAYYDLQQTMGNLVETVPGIQQILGYPCRYPHESALLVFEQALREVEETRRLINQGNYEEAASELRIAKYDMGLSIEVLEMTIKDTGTNFGVAQTIIDAEDDLMLWYEPPHEVLVAQDIRKAVELIKQTQERLTVATTLLEEGSYSDAIYMLNSMANHLTKTHNAINNTIGRIERTWSYPDADISLYFIKSAKGRLRELHELIGQDEFEPTEFTKELRMAQHHLEISNTILSNNLLVVFHGLSLKAKHDYKLNLDKAIVTLQDTRDEFINTIILAPFDGTVVNVGLQEGDQLSSQDYSSRPAVHLVDTKTIHFDGIVDEVDISRVEVEQKATIIIDALPDEQFTGTVTFISPLGTGETGVVNFGVTIELDPTEIQLKGSLTATADINIESAKNVLFIPAQAVIDTTDGYFVEVIINETTMKTERRQIVPGIQTYQFAEVISGLREGEKVVVIDSSTSP